MDIEKCILISRDNNGNGYEYQWLDESYNMIPNIVPEKKLIKDIDFNNLPSNVFNNIELFLGKNYYLTTFNEWLYCASNKTTLNGYIFNFKSDFGKELNKLVQEYKQKTSP